jgi:hypothetical protein
VTGRNRTCDAPRFRRALYRAELRSREMGGAGVEPAPPPYQRGALPPELSAEWARLGSNQQPLVCKTSALPLSYSPVSAPGQGVEPRSPRSERGVLPVRRSRNGPRLSVHPHAWRSTQQAGAGFRRVLWVVRLTANDVVHATRLLFDPGSPIVVCAHPQQSRPTWRSFGARASWLSVEMGMLKRTLIASVHFQHSTPRVFLSQAGPRFDLELVQAEHHLRFRR